MALELLLCAAAAAPHLSFRAPTHLSVIFSSEVRKLKERARVTTVKTRAPTVATTRTCSSAMHRVYTTLPLAAG